MSEIAEQAGTTRVAAYALVLDDVGRILLVRIAPGYPSVGRWTLPGGGLQFGEHPADAVIRELAEETGLSGTVDSLAFVDSYSRPADDENPAGAWHAIRIVYRVQSTGGTLRHEQDESTDMAAWFSPRDALELPLVSLAELALEHLSSR